MIIFANNDFPAFITKVSNRFAHKHIKKYVYLRVWRRQSAVQLARKENAQNRVQYFNKNALLIVRY